MPKIYVAGGWFSDEQVEALDDLEYVVQLCSRYSNFMPRHMNLGVEGVNWDSIFKENIKHLNNSSLVVASTVGKDMGTMWECGYAYAKNIPIVYYTPGIDKPNLMLGKSGIICKTKKELMEYLLDGTLPEGVKDYE